MMSSHLKLAWWNTSLSPLGRERATGDQLEIAVLLIETLLFDEKVDFLGLGEVCTHDIDVIRRRIDQSEFNLFVDHQTFGKLKFDSAVIYNKSKLNLLEHRNLIGQHGRLKLKISTRIDALIKNTSELFFIFLCHWPSRLRGSDASRKRESISSELRKEILELQNGITPLPRIILMGDFNDEPFDKSLSHNLLATRDRTIAKNNHNFFYNPFWKKLGEVHSFPGISETQNICGTYFHRSGHETKWHTFDQIILSSNFLNEDDWHLNERYLEIGQWPAFLSLVKKDKEIFDHLPVIAVVQKRD